MNILFIGDIFGEVGRDLVADYLPKLKEKYQIDFVVANGENATHGKGISKKHYDELLNNGVNCLTMGNHTFDRSDILDWIDHANCLVRPANYSKYTPGQGTKVFEVNNKTIQITNLLGRVFYGGIINHPVEILEDIVANSNADIHIVDIHADATAEKICLGYEFDGQVSAILGTHTHVQTADERILDNGTAYITDVGMCGPYNQCIGMDKKNVVYRMKTGLPASFEPGGHPGILCGVVVKIADNNQVTAIERVNLSPLNNYEM
ncbi:TIGR00282 family metallophosphoesterase [Erysipelotrichaceae bacterium OttesenSCG-928-M19]|nr:TIGR00282 family metallophosphoesterase [Erysipelotrichaceae bacterium OttesenSCG-928-M19]